MANLYSANYIFVVTEREQFEAEHRNLIFEIARGCTTKKEYEDVKRSYVDFLNRDGLLVNKQACLDYFYL